MRPPASTDQPMPLADVNLTESPDAEPVSPLMVIVGFDCWNIAVIVEPDRPNETALLADALLEKKSRDPSAVSSPPFKSKRILVSDVATDPVTTEPFSPKETPFELLNVNAERLFDVVPAEILKFVSDVATLAVTVLPLIPNETPLRFEKVSAERLLLVVPALTLMAVNDVATDPVTVLPLSPKETPFELLKTT